ncbi:MAG: hypothetical protein Q4F72_10450 [Desulfovibrionaceae bacterium]|nr:hypothetical protein [Desulfovibrionaceae bacterium]
MSLCYADEPDYNPRCLLSLSRLGVDLDDDVEFRACALICASLARSGMRRDGTAGLGEAIWLSVNHRFAETRLCTVLDCFSLRDVCRALEPVLYAVARKASGCLCHARLLDELREFESAREDIRRTWVADFNRARKAARRDMRGTDTWNSRAGDQDFDDGPSPR